MRQNHSLLLAIPAIAASVFISACTKDSPSCGGYTEITERGHLVDLAPLNDAPEFFETLKDHPELQVYRAINDQYAVIMHCHIFYKDLEILTDNFMQVKGKKHNVNYSQGEIPEQLNISLEPSIDSGKAIKIAKRNMEFGQECISFKLAIYDLNASGRGLTKDYKLVWLVTGENKYPKVIVDANSGEVHSMDDGMRY